MTDTTPAAEAIEVPGLLDQIDTHTRELGVSQDTINADSAFVVERFREDERLVVHSLEEHLPRPLRQRGEVAIHDPADFVQFVNQLANVNGHRTRVYADVDRNQVVAVFDDHGEDGQAGWRQHRAILALKPDADWQLWAAADGRLVRQDVFASFLEDVAHTVVSPDAATMWEVATSFRAARRADFSSEINVQNGDVQLTYKEETDAKAGRTRSGDVEIPKEFTVRIAPWRGVDPVDVTARLRYHVDQGHLGIGFSLLRADRAKDDAFATLLARVREALDGIVPLLKANAPAALTARSDA
ncbi:DUF2303 family protein [Saccharothrix sp. HUAS TT1]|uniref:DUF2303 family protein n=1 Tax=unclassified Saccharothrix TaxID=2593673 RepID=UPI00345BFE7C